MSLQIENVLPDGFAFEKAQNVAHGKCQGIEFIIVPMDAENQYQIQLYTDAEKSADKEAFLAYLGTMIQNYPFVRHAGYNGSNMASVYVLAQGQEDKENLMAAISTLASKCAEYGVHNCCAHCKNDVPLHAVAVDQAPLLLCDNCLSQVTSRMGGQRARKENVFLGLIGAIVGVLLGSALWIVIGELGFIAGIAGFAIVFAGMKGYEILGGKLSKFGIFISVLLSLLAIVGAEFVPIAIAIYREWHEMYGITIGDAFGLIPEFMKEPEMVVGVAKDLIVGYLLAIWASYSNVKRAWHLAGGETAEHTVVRF